MKRNQGGGPVSQKKVFLVGIAGPPGAGKTTIAKRLKKSGKKFEHIVLDDYFKSPEKFPRKSGFTNWEIPSNLDFGKLYNHLKRLKSGKGVTASYYFFWPTKRKEKIKLEPRRFVIAEGFLTFKDKRIRNILDLKIYLKTSFDIALERRREKFSKLGIETEEYNKKVVLPEYKKWGASQIKYADVVVSGDQPSLKAGKEIKKIISKKLKS
jgi:uridine kinase